MDEKRKRARPAWTRHSPETSSQTLDATMTDHAAESFQTRLSVRHSHDDENDLTVHVHRRPTTGPIRHNNVDSTSLVCGLFAGVAQAGVFNPYDRALYLSVKHERRFLSLKNWSAPYTGFYQSLGQRAIAGGLYFPLEHFFLRCMSVEESVPRRNLLAGTAAGAVNAIVLNPLTAVKYKTWGREENRGFVREALAMLRKSGSLRPFTNGLVPTLYRDIVFGGCYTWLRLQLQWYGDLPPERQWQANLVAAGLATVASGPFNYARNIQYATSSRSSALSTSQVLQDLWNQVRAEPTLERQLRLVQDRLRIGWGTARVALGMAFAHAVYDHLQHYVRHNV